MLAEINDIQKYLEIECSNNPEEVQERISRIAVYMARTGELLADAKKALRRKKSSEISNTIIAIAKESCLSAKVQNALLESIAEDEAYLVDRLERMNKACTHQLDALRSLLSYAKTDLQIAGYGGYGA